MNDFKHYGNRGRGSFQPNNNFRGSICKNVRRAAPNNYNTSNYKDNKYRWPRPPHSNNWRNSTPRLPYMRHRMPPPFMQRPTPRPMSPLPGSEEARQKVIAEASARIKEQLNLNENQSSFNVSNAPFPTDFGNKFNNDCVTVEHENTKSINDKPLERNLKRKNKKTNSGTSMKNVEELRKKIITQLNNMTKEKIQNLVNNPGSSRYDGVLQHLVRDMRLHLSAELRNMYSNRESDAKESNEMINHFNSIVPDLGVELVSLPDAMVAELSNILQFDANNEVQESPSLSQEDDNELVEPEDMFKQAEKLLLNTDFIDLPDENPEQDNERNNIISPEPTANFYNNSPSLVTSDPFMNRSPICNEPHPFSNSCPPTIGGDVLETADMDIDDNDVNETCEQQEKSQEDAIVNLELIPLPIINETDTIEQVDENIPVYSNDFKNPSRESSPFSKKVLDANLPISTSPIPTSNIETIVEPKLTIPTTEQSVPQLFNYESVWISKPNLLKTKPISKIDSVHVTSFLDDVISNNFCDSINNEPKTREGNNLKVSQETLKSKKDKSKLNSKETNVSPPRNRLSLDERIKMMMKMKETKSNVESKNKKKKYKINKPKAEKVFHNEKKQKLSASHHGKYKVRVKVKYDKQAEANRKKSFLKQTSKKSNVDNDADTFNINNIKIKEEIPNVNEEINEEQYYQRDSRTPSIPLEVKSEPVPEPQEHNSKNITQFEDNLEEFTTTTDEQMHVEDSVGISSTQNIENEKKVDEEEKLKNKIDEKVEEPQTEEGLVFAQSTIENITDKIIDNTNEIIETDVENQEEAKNLNDDNISEKINLNNENNCKESAEVLENNPEETRNETCLENILSNLKENTSIDVNKENVPATVEKINENEENNDKILEQKRQNLEFLEKPKEEIHIDDNLNKKDDESILNNNSVAQQEKIPVNKEEKNNINEVQLFEKTANNLENIEIKSIDKTEKVQEENQVEDTKINKEPNKTDNKTDNTEKSEKKEHEKTDEVSEKTKDHQNRTDKSKHHKTNETVKSKENESKKSNELDLKNKSKSRSSKSNHEHSRDKKSHRSHSHTDESKKKEDKNKNSKKNLPESSEIQKNVLNIQEHLPASYSKADTDMIFSKLIAIDLQILHLLQEKWELYKQLNIKTDPSELIENLNKNKPFELIEKLGISTIPSNLSISNHPETNLKSRGVSLPRSESSMNDHEDKTVESDEDSKKWDKKKRKRKISDSDKTQTPAIEPQKPLRKLRQISKPPLMSTLDLNPKMKTVDSETETIPKKRRKVEKKTEPIKTNKVANKTKPLDTKIIEETTQEMKETNDNIEKINTKKKCNENGKKTVKVQKNKNVNKPEKMNDSKKMCVKIKKQDKKYHVEIKDNEEDKLKVKTKLEENDNNKEIKENENIIINDCTQIETKNVNEEDNLKEKIIEDEINKETNKRANKNKSKKGQKTVVKSNEKSNECKKIKISNNDKKVEEDHFFEENSVDSLSKQTKSNVIDEKVHKIRSRSTSKESDYKIKVLQKKFLDSSDDEIDNKPLKIIRKCIASESDASESSCIDEKSGIDKKINTKRKRQLSTDSNKTDGGTLNNKPVPENKDLKSCYIKLERINVLPVNISGLETSKTVDKDTIMETDESVILNTTDLEENPNDEEIQISKEHDNLETCKNDAEIESFEEVQDKEDTLIEITDKCPDNTDKDESKEIETNDKDEISKIDENGIFCVGHQKSILDIKIIGNEFLAASEDGTIYKYCIKTGNLQDAYTGHERAVTCIYILHGSVINVDATLMYSGSLDCSLKCYNTDTAEILHSVKVDQAIQCMDSAWGYIFLGTYEGLLFIYNIQKKYLNEESLTIANATVLMIKATQEGSRQVLILASRKREIMVRDAFTGLLLRTMCQDEKPTIYSLLLYRSLVYCGTSDKGILILDFNNGNQTGSYNSGKGVVCMVMYKNLLFAGCYDGMIYIYDTRTQKHITTLPGPGNGMLLSLAISNGMIVAGSKKDHLLKIWKIPQEILYQNE